ncbi:hypothetical protein N507_1678 [Lacticaseibacillus rhamnosus DSM 14870]|nr:hypothetical protein N507_1678 [Lacticaseibacillus rhamnosus DSM 14870]
MEEKPVFAPVEMRLTLLIVVLMLAAFYVILGILLFAVNTP